jgi:hypothetical protein
MNAYQIVMLAGDHVVSAIVNACSVSDALAMFSDRVVIDVYRIDFAGSLVG